MFYGKASTYQWLEPDSWDVYPNCLLYLTEVLVLHGFTSLSTLICQDAMRWGNQREVDMWPCHSQVTVRTQIVRLFRERKPLIVFNDGVSDRESSSISRSIKKNVKLGNTNPFSVFFLLAYFLSFKNLCMTCMWDVLYMCVCSYVWPLQCVWVLLYMCVCSCVWVLSHMDVNTMWRPENSLRSWSPPCLRQSPLLFLASWVMLADPRASGYCSVPTSYLSTQVAGYRQVLLCLTGMCSEDSNSGPRGF